jgi:serine/threonine-protein kinase RsbW
LAVAAGRLSILDIRLQSRPESAGLVRAMLSGIAAPLGLRGQVLDDVKTALSEACNNAVEHAYRGECGPIAVHLDVQPAGLAATVRDWGGGFHEIAPSGRGMRVGLPLINALADRAEFLSAPGSGTEVRMAFNLPHDPDRAALVERLGQSDDLTAWAPRRRGLSGELVVTLLPAELLAGVLGPLTSAFAARTRFSLERFSDVYLATSAIVEHAAMATTSSGVSFALTGAEHQLTLTIGPLRAGASMQLQTPAGASGQLRAPTSGGRATGSLARLVTELECETIDDSEMLRFVLANHEPNLSGAQD